MKEFNWKKSIGLALSVMVLLVGTMGLTGCEAEEVEEGEGVELEED